MADPKKFPFVSVIAPLYNGRDDLPGLLDCLAAQTYPRDRLEFLLVDNNSQDETFEILQGAIARFKDLGFSLIPLQELEIQSSYAARNRGIHQARGDILAFVDGDCRPEPDWLMELVKPFWSKNGEELGMVAGEIQALPGSSLIERYSDRQDILSQKHTLASNFLPYGQTANLAIRRWILREIGLFRSHLTTGGDADICWRMQRSLKRKIILAPKAIVRHRHRATITEFRSQFRRYGKSNTCLHKLYGVPLMTPWSQRDYLVRPLRWLLKETPIAIAKRLLGRSPWSELDLDLWDTPLEFIGMRSRYLGQRSSQLPDRAQEIPPCPDAWRIPKDKK